MRWVREIGEGLTTLAIEVPEPAAVTHVVRMIDFRTWIDARGATPAQMMAKERARDSVKATTTAAASHFLFHTAFIVRSSPVQVDRDSLLPNNRCLGCQSSNRMIPHSLAVDSR